MMSALSLGGPGPGCSLMRLRRLAAGELEGIARAQMEEHVAGCARCLVARQELEEEQRAVRAALPFDRFAAGVAERLVEQKRMGRADANPSMARRVVARRWIPMALAASLATAGAVPLLMKKGAPELAGVLVSTPVQDRLGVERGIRLKGGEASISVYVQENGVVRSLPENELLPAKAGLRVGLSTGKFGHAAVIFVDTDGPELLYAGPVSDGPVPGAFEWTGVGEASVVAVLAPRAIDAKALVARVAQRGVKAAQEPGAKVLTRRLVRAGAP